MTIESFLGGPRPGVRRGWAGFRASASMTTCARRSRAATATSDHLEPAVRRSCAATTRFTRRPARRRRRARRARSRARSATSRPGSGRRGGSARWPSSTSITPTGATGSRCRAATRPAGYIVAERLAHRARGAAAVAADRLRLRPGARSSRVPLDGYLKLGRQLLPRAGGAGPSARRAALRPRPRLDRASRRDRRALPAQLRARRPGCRRRGCAPSRRRRRR